MKVKRSVALPIVAVVALLLVFPLFWMFTTAFKPDLEVSGGTTLWPQHPTLENFRYVWSRIPIVRYFVNSLAVGVAVTLGQILTSILAAYAFSRVRFPGRDTLFLMSVGTMLVPFQITMIPNFLLIARLDWINTLSGIAAPHMASAFGIFFLRQHLLGFPASLEEAAIIEGASRWQVLWRIIVPVNRSALGALAALFFINSWNEYFWPLLIATGPQSTTLPLGLARFTSVEGGNLFGPLMAAAVMATVPAMVLFLLAQNRIMNTFSRSGLTG